MEIKIFVTPDAPRNRVVQLKDGSLKVSVSVPATKGQANKAVIVLLAKWADVTAEAVSIVKGHRSRRKTIQIESIQSVGGHNEGRKADRRCDGS